MTRPARMERADDHDEGGVMARGTTVDFGVTMVTETCYACNVLFAMTEDHRDRLVKSKKSFYCPNGHAQHYTGKSDAQRIKDLQAEVERADRRTEMERRSKQYESRRRAAAQGQVTKIKRRIAAGKCPSCRSEFPDLAAHMAHEHPEWTDGDATP